MTGFSTRHGPCPALVDQAAVGVVSEWETEETNFEGLRVKVDEGAGKGGWLMNRMSLHEPIVIFNVESVRLLCNTFVYSSTRRCTEQDTLLPCVEYCFQVVA